MPLAEYRFSPRITPLSTNRILGRLSNTSSHLKLRNIMLEQQFLYYVKQPVITTNIHKSIPKRVHTKPTILSLESSATLHRIEHASLHEYIEEIGSGFEYIEEIGRCLEFNMLY